MSLYAQHGYGKGNKIEKALSNNIIDGVILCPRAESPEKIRDFVKKLKQDHENADCYFDPMFFLGYLHEDINLGKLSLYPYFKSELTNAHLSIPSNIHNYAKETVDFQKGLLTSAIFSPTIAINSFNSRESQIAISLAYETITVVKSSYPIFVSLCIHESAFKDTASMESFLNSISLLDVDGFYLVVERESNISKAAEIDSAILSNLLYFSFVLSIINNYELIYGFSDLLSIPLSVASNASFASGWFSNLKSFSVANYRPASGGRRPRKRYMSEPLMNSILLVPELLSLIQANSFDLAKSDSPYNTIIFPNMSESAWSDEVSCLHNWTVLRKMINETIEQGDVLNRIEYLKNKIAAAEVNYKKIINIFPQLEPKSNSSHLSMWNDALECFENKLGV